MKRSLVYCMVMTLASLLLIGLLCSGMVRHPIGAGTLEGKRQVVAALALTDLSLSSEARYTRHPSQADLFSAFQDFPAAIEHFPSGAMIPPPVPAGLTSRMTIKPGQRAGD